MRIKRVYAYEALKIKLGVYQHTHTKIAVIQGDFFFFNESYVSRLQWYC